MENSKLFAPVTVGATPLAHRIAMAPLTRFRATDAHVPTELMVQYYTQRAAVPGTLLIAEATDISPRSGGYANTPGVWTDEQAAAWRKVTDAVHAQGSKIWVQLWALGRAAYSEPGVRLAPKDDAFDLERNYVSSSAVPMVPGYPAPRPLAEDEIWQFVDDFKAAAKNAVEKAGFDGVELHGAHGYLIDQFTQDTANKRTDTWGGSIENRTRFAIECCKAVSAAIGPERTAIRLSPWNTVQGMRMADPVPTFTYLIKQLSALKLAALHLVEPRVHGIFDKDPSQGESLQFALEAWGKERPVFIAGGFTPELAKKAVESTYKDYDAVIVFGRRFISTPDLVYRVKKGIEWNEYDRNTFYIFQKENRDCAKGYVDYPFSKEYVSEFGKPAGTDEPIKGKI